MWELLGIAAITLPRGRHDLDLDLLRQSLRAGAPMTEHNTWSGNLAPLGALVAIVAVLFLQYLSKTIASPR